MATLFYGLVTVGGLLAFAGVFVLLITDGLDDILPPAVQLQIMVLILSGVAYMIITGNSRGGSSDGGGSGGGSCGGGCGGCGGGD